MDQRKFERAEELLTRAAMLYRVSGDKVETARVLVSHDWRALSAGLESWTPRINKAKPAPVTRIAPPAAPVVSLSLFFDKLPLNNLTAWLAVALGGILWFALIFAGLGVFQRRGTAGT